MAIVLFQQYRKDEWIQYLVAQSGVSADEIAPLIPEYPEYI